MEFSLPKTLEILERTPSVLNTLLTGLSSEWTSATEGGDTWSVFDVVGHLIHGEKTDWIPRVEIILQYQDTKAFKPFDRFAQFEESKGKTLTQLLAEFETLRKENLQKLASFNLQESHLKLKGKHPALGEVTLSELLATWLAHDLNHISQISRIMAKQYKNEVGVWVEYLRILQS